MCDVESTSHSGPAAAGCICHTPGDTRRCLTHVQETKVPLGSLQETPWDNMHSGLAVPSGAGHKAGLRSQKHTPPSKRPSPSRLLFFPSPPVWPTAASGNPPFSPGREEFSKGMLQALGFNLGHKGSRLREEAWKNPWLEEARVPSWSPGCWGQVWGQVCPRCPLPSV